MRLIIKENTVEVGLWTANYIANRINDHNARGKDPFVLGLPTGSTPIETYSELIRMNKAGKVSFKNVVTFNMDEYVGLPKEHPESYHSFMHKYLFDHIDIDPKNINILNGNAPDLARECLQYEERILAAGGIDLFLGGIGSDGHIAFNEPFSSLQSRTRMMWLAKQTIMDNARFFGNDLAKVPQSALTVGVATVMDAREVVIVTNGKSKAHALKMGIEGAYSHIWTISAIQAHPNAIVVCDTEATTELSPETVDYFLYVEAK